MKTIVWIGRFLRGGFAENARRNVQALLLYTDNIIVAPLYVLPQDHPLYPYVKDFDEENQPENYFKVLNHIPLTDPTADAYYSVWEYDKIPNSWAEILDDDHTRLIMTESTFCKEIFQKSLSNDKNITVIPYILPEDIINYDPYGPIYRPKSRFIDDKTFLFGSVFEWVPRKVPERTIIAFLKEFTENENVALIFRTKYPEDNDYVKGKMGKYYDLFMDALKKGRIVIEEGYIPNIVNFYRGMNAYISATAGEGYGQTLAEAMACGLPTIGSDHSGNLDFMDDSNSFLVDVHDWSPVDDNNNSEQFRWKLPKIESIRARMREVYEIYKHGDKNHNAPWAIDLRRRLTPENIGKLIYKTLKPFL